MCLLRWCFIFTWLIIPPSFISPMWLIFPSQVRSYWGGSPLLKQLDFTFSFEASTGNATITLQGHTFSVVYTNAESLKIYCIKSSTEVASGDTPGRRSSAFCSLCKYCSSQWLLHRRLSFIDWTNRWWCPCNFNHAERASPTPCCHRSKGSSVLCACGEHHSQTDGYPSNALEQLNR